MGSLLQLLFPTTCLICEVPGVTVCTKCESQISRVLSAREFEGVKLWAGAYYGHELAQLILLAKEENNGQARNFLVRLLVETFMNVGSEMDRASHVTFIPIPSSAAANRKRGYRHAYLLARGAASQIAKASSHRVDVREVLRVNRKIADQSNLNRSERIQNLSGAYSASVHDNLDFAQWSANPIILIDDLVTSGSSISEGLRALRQQGITPFGVLSAGVSPRVFS